MFLFDVYKEFVKKLSRPDKNPGILESEVYAEHDDNLTAEANYDRGFNACFAGIAIEARKIMLNRKGLAEFPLVTASGERALFKAVDKSNTIRMGLIMSKRGIEPIDVEVAMPKVPAPIVDVSATLEDVIKNHILRVLAAHGNNKTQAAKTLGITIKTLYNKLEAYGISPGELELRARCRSGRKGA